MSKELTAACIAVGLFGAVCGHLSAKLSSSAKLSHATTAPVDARSQQVVDGSFPSATAPAIPQWAEIESDDIFQLVANLRRIGCPERIIAVIARARVTAAYRERINEAKNPLAKYWSPPAELAAMSARADALVEERDKILYEDLKLDRPSDLQSLGLAAEKQARVQEARRNFPAVRVTADSTESQRQQARANRKARVDYLANYLTDQELLDYRMNQDGLSATIGFLLRDVKLTEDEFARAFLAIDNEDLTQTNGSLRPDLEERLREALGPEKYAEYRDATLPQNYLLAQLAREFNLSPEQVQQLKDLRAKSETAFRLTPAGNAAYEAAVHAVLNNGAAERRFFSSPVYCRLPKQGSASK